jgi:hypothetical protein
MKALKIVFLFALLSIACRLYAQVDSIAYFFKGFTQLNYSGSIDERYFPSKETNSTFVIKFYLPSSYADTQKKYPVLVLTDAVWSMGIAQTTFDYMTIFRVIPEVIIVGIGYPSSSLLDWMRYRYRDMLPTHVEGYNPSGSADKFMAFIKNELFPYIEKNYRIDTTDRCFWGHSFGGLLGSHILIEQPQLFNRYIIGSPSYWWDNNEIVKRLSSKSSLSADSVKTVFTFIGGKEGEKMVNNWKEFNSILVTKINKNIKFQDQFFQDETHQSVVPASFSTAVKFVYKK